MYYSTLHVKSTHWGILNVEKGYSILFESMTPDLEKHFPSPGKYRLYDDGRKYGFSAGDLFVDKDGCLCKRQ